MLSWMNNYDRWVAGFKYMHEKNLTELPPRSKKNKHEPWNVGKFTDSEGGNDKFGGWSTESKKLYSNLVIDLQNHRAENADRVAEVEKIMLEAIQKKEGIKDKSLRRKKKAKSSSQTQASQEEDWDETPLIFDD